MEMSVTEVIFSFLGGLGIFLYGLKIMGDGLQASAGDRLRDILNKFTSNPVCYCRYHCNYFNTK